MKDDNIRDMLCKWLGELEYYKENTFDWIEKEHLIAKINAIYVLLDIDKKEKTFMEAVNEVMTKTKGHER